MTSTHDMNNPGSSQPRSRAIVIIIALVSIVPFGLAWYYANHPELIEKTSNYGMLIQPAQQLDVARILAQPLRPQNGLERIKGRWLLLQVATGPCVQECAETLHKTHQGWLMLNKEMPRVQRLLLASPESKAAESDAVRNDDALLTAGLTQPVLQALTRAMGKPPGDGMVILVDPFANLVLWYDAGFDPYKMVKDLKHLLKASQIG